VSVEKIALPALRTFWNPWCLRQWCLLLIHHQSTVHHFSRN